MDHVIVALVSIFGAFLLHFPISRFYVSNCSGWLSMGSPQCQAAYSVLGLCLSLLQNSWKMVIGSIATGCAGNVIQRSLRAADSSASPPTSSKGDPDPPQPR